MSSTVPKVPLGEATKAVLNTGHAPNKHSAESLERKLKRALASEAEQRRKRAEAEGAADAAQEEVVRLRRELERCSKVNKPTSSSSSDGQTEKLQKQFDDLLKRYHDSRTKYHSQITKLQNRHRELEAVKLNPVGEAGLSTMSRSVGRPEVIEKLEAQNARLVAQVEEFRQSTEVQTEASAASSSIGLERDVLLDQIQQASIAYGTLCRRSVDRTYAQQLSEELALERVARFAAESRLAIASADMAEIQAELDGCRRAEQLYSSELAMAEEQIQCMRIRQAEQRLDSKSARPEEPVAMPPHQDSDEVSRILDLAICHIDLLQSDTSSQIAQLLKTNAEMTASTDSALHAAASIHAELVALRTTTADLQSRFTALETAHAACTPAIDELRGKWKKSEAEVMRVKVLVHEAERKVADLEARNQADKEVLKRAVDTASRARMAEEALDQDIADLRDALAQKAPFEPLYHALKEEHEILLSRQGMTLEELDRMGEMNAELIRGGEDGKIGYIEGVRRDMAIVKHELATTRHRLNTANDRIADLETELEAFRCIDQPVMSGLGGSGRVRVVRRQPEGSAVLGASTAGGAVRRSVSSSQAKSGR